jgi:hypothetical protein
MSTLVQVKEENIDGGAYSAETDSESDESIDVTKLASLSKYPVGCKVLCNLRRLPASIIFKQRLDRCKRFIFTLKMDGEYTK